MSATPELTVLVVDDDFMVASIHTRFVDRVEGFRTIGQATTGEAALSEIARLSPDLVLLDVHLPDISGIEVLRRLRGSGNDVGVMMVTAAREADTVRAAVAGGAAHYLVKPFEHHDLAERLLAFRESHDLLAGVGTAAQTDIDVIFAPVGTGRSALPKGLSRETAESVLGVLSGGVEASATESAERVGISRVSARRYLEHFVATGQAAVRLQYGGAGRPERRYRSTR